MTAKPFLMGSETEYSVSAAPSGRQRRRPPEALAELIISVVRQNSVVYRTRRFTMACFWKTVAGCTTIFTVTPSTARPSVSRPNRLRPTTRQGNESCSTRKTSERSQLDRRYRHQEQSHSHPSRHGNVWESRELSLLDRLAASGTGADPTPGHAAPLCRCWLPVGSPTGLGI